MAKSADEGIYHKVDWEKFMGKEINTFYTWGCREGRPTCEIYHEKIIVKLGIYLFTNSQNRYIIQLLKQKGELKWPLF